MLFSAEPTVPLAAGVAASAGRSGATAHWLLLILLHGLLLLLRLVSVATLWRALLGHIALRSCLLHRVVCSGTGIPQLRVALHRVVGSCLSLLLIRRVHTGDRSLILHRV